MPAFESSCGGTSAAAVAADDDSRYCPPASRSAYIMRASKWSGGGVGGGFVFAKSVLCTDVLYAGRPVPACELVVWNGCVGLIVLC